MSAKIKLGQKLMVRLFGCSKNDRAATWAHKPLLMSALPSDTLTITRVTEKNIWVTDTYNFTRRVSKLTIERALMHGLTNGNTTSLYGPFEFFDCDTRSRDTKWFAAKDTKENLAKMRYALAQESRVTLRELAK